MFISILPCSHWVGSWSPDVIDTTVHVRPSLTFAPTRKVTTILQQTQTPGDLYIIDCYTHHIQTVTYIIVRLLHTSYSDCPNLSVFRCCLYLKYTTSCVLFKGLNECLVSWSWHSAFRFPEKHFFVYTNVHTARNTHKLISSSLPSAIPQS